MPQSDDARFFTRELMRWHAEINARELPWKGLRDPYKIWLSEIILQQTRAEQGRPYYERFIEAYPTIHDLAAAPDDEVFRLWQGLGYYNRCRNLLHTARYISKDLNGEFPSTYEGLLELKGVGSYTAAAIASFAFGLAHAVVDGNVYRVLARYFGISTPTNSAEGKNIFHERANTVLDRQDPGGFNQAIMDHGATVCTPVSPDCPACPVQERCYAYNNRVIGELPAKTAKAALKQRYFHYIVLRHADQVWLRKRTEGIWANLYEPLLIESSQPLDRQAVVQTEEVQRLGVAALDLEYEGVIHRKLTHQSLEIRFFSATVNAQPSGLDAAGVWVPVDQLSNYPLPKALELFFAKKDYF